MTFLLEVLRYYSGGDTPDEPVNFPSGTSPTMPKSLHPRARHTLSKLPSHTERTPSLMLPCRYAATALPSANHLYIVDWETPNNCLASSAGNSTLPLPATSKARHKYHNRAHGSRDMLEWTRTVKTWTTISAARATANNGRVGDTWTLLVKGSPCPVAP